MKMPILNIIIRFFLIFQFSLVNLNILHDFPNDGNTNILPSIEECGESGSGCFIINLWFKQICWCPLKPKENLIL